MNAEVVLQLVVYGLGDGAVVALNAAGFTLAYAVARQMNLAQGNVFALTAVLVVQAARWLNVGPDAPLAGRLLALGLLAMTGAAIGALLNFGVERLAFRPFWGGGATQAPLVASLGLAFVLFQGVFWMWQLFPTVAALDRAGHQGVNMAIRAMPELLPAVELGTRALSFTLKDALVQVLALALAIGGGLMLRRTRIGRGIRAVSEDPELAAMLGADRRRIQSLTFAAAGALSGFAAFVFVLYHGGATAAPQRAWDTVSGRATPAGRRLLLVLLAAGLLLPFVDTLVGWHRLPSATAALILAALAVGLSLVVALAGLLDLGHAAFFAIGSYTAAMLSASGSRLAGMLPDVLREPWVGLPIAALVAAAAGVVFGMPTLRTRGEYLAIVTLAIGVIVPDVLGHLDVVGAARGISGVALPRFGALALGAPLQAYLLVLAAMVLITLAALRLADARVGRTWIAVRDDDTAAAASGIDPWRARLLAFVLGAGSAGLMGALFAGQWRGSVPGRGGAAQRLSIARATRPEMAATIRPASK